MNDLKSYDELRDWLGRNGSKPQRTRVIDFLQSHGVKYWLIDDYPVTTQKALDSALMGEKERRIEA